LEKEIVPQLFAGKTSPATVCVWSVGTATGDEAYGAKTAKENKSLSQLFCQSG